MNATLLNLTTLAASFLALFGSAELMYHTFSVRVELSRKYVHIVTGFLTLLFPIMLESHWWVLLLCGSFALILYASQRYSLLPSINAIDRTSRGSLLYPLAVYLCFLAFEWKEAYVYFYLPVLIMAISDPIAALTGKRWPIGKYRIRKETKTLMGSTMFFISACLVAYVLLASLTPEPWWHCWVLSLTIAFATAIAEALSQKGYDNLSIPLTALSVLLLVMP